MCERAISVRRLIHFRVDTITRRMVSSPLLVFLSFVVVLLAPFQSSAGEYVYWTGDNGNNWSTGSNSNWLYYNYYSQTWVDYGQHPQNDDYICFEPSEVSPPVNYTNTNLNYAGQRIASLKLSLDNIGIYGQSFTLDGQVELNEGLHATIGNNITLTPGIPYGARFYADSGAVLTLSGALSGDVDAWFAGQGTYRLQGSNTYTGTTLLGGGVIEFSSNTNLGAAAAGLTLDSAPDGSRSTLRYTGAGTATVNRSLESAGSSSGGACLDVTNAGTVLTWSGPVTGVGGVSKTGPGKLVLSGANTFEGQISVDGGTLAVSSVGNLGSASLIVLQGGTFQNQGTINYDGAISIGSGNSTVNTTADLTVESVATRYDAVAPMLLKTGSGTLEVKNLGALVTVNDGTLRYTGHLIDYYDITNNAILQLAPDADLTYSTTLSGTGRLIKSGTKKLTFTGTRTGTGRTTITGGLMEVASDAKLGTAPASYVANQLELDGGGLKTTASFSLPANRGITLGADNATLIVDSGTTLTAGGIITGSGNLLKTGTGTLVLNANNTFTGNLEIAQGTVRCGPVNALTSSTLVTLNTGTTLDLNGTTQWFEGVTGGGSLLLGAGEFKSEGSGNTELSGVISGTGHVIKGGTGTLTLSGSNTYTGYTRVSGGTLRLVGGSSIANSASVILDDASGVQLVLNANEEIGQLSGGGAYGGDVYLNGYRLTLGQSNANTTFTGHFADAGYITKTGSGTFTIAGYCNFTGATIGQGTLKSSAGTLCGAIVNNATLEFNQTGDGTYYDSISGTGALVKTGAGTLTLNAVNTYAGPTSINEGALKVLGGNAINNASAVRLADVFGTALELGANEEIGSLAGTGATGGEVDLAAYALTLGGTNEDMSFGGLIYGTGGQLIKKGTGTLTLTGSCSYTGGTTVQAGTLKGNVISLQGNIANSGTVEFSQSSSGTYLGVLSGTGTLVKTGTGTLTLGGVNTYTGDTHVVQGTLRMGSGDILTSSTVVTVDAGATLDLDDMGEGIGGLAGAGNVTMGSGDLGLYGNASTTFSGVISGSGSLVKSGTGTLELWGANTYSGGTTVSNGILRGNATGLQGNITNSTSVVFDQASLGTYAGNMNGGGAVTKEGPGTLALTGSNTYSGGTTISQGTLQIGDGGTTGSVTGSVVNNGSLVFRRSDTYTFGGSISGTGSVSQNGTGTLNLTTTNSYSGGTTVTGGTLGIGSDGRLGAAAGALTLNGGTVKSTGMFSFATGRSIVLAASGGTFDTNSYTTTIPPVVSGTGTLTKTGLGSLVLTGTNTYSGGTTVSQGTLQIGNGGTAGLIAGNIADNGSLVFNHSDTYTSAGNISGTGSVTQNGTGTLNLTGANTYSGGTTVAAGTLGISSDSKLGSTVGALTLNGGTVKPAASFTFSSGRSIVLGSGGGTFNTNGYDTTIASPISGDGSLTKIGAGILDLTGINAYTGKTTVSEGTLRTPTVARLGADPSSYVADQLTLNGGTFQTTATTNFAANRGITLGTAGGTFITDTGTLSVNGPIVGTGGLAKNGAGTLSLYGTCTFGGPTAVNQGTLRLYRSNALPATMSLGVASGATFNMVGYVQTLSSLSGQGNVALGSGTLTVNNSSDVTFSGVLTGSGGNLTKTGAAAFVLAGANTYTGITSIQQGTVRLGGNDRLAGSSSVSISSGAYLDLNGFGQTLGGLSGSGGVTLNGGALTVGYGGFSTSYGGVISGSGSVTKTGTGTLTLNGTNSYSGPTAVTGGILAVDSAAAIPASSSLAVDAGAKVRFTTPTGQEWSFGSPISGAGNLEKTGTGTLVLAANASYSGTTTVTQGTLRVNDTLQTAGGTVTIGASGTLEASGVIRRDLTGSGRLVLTDTLYIGSSGDGVDLSNGSVQIGAYELAFLSPYNTMLGGGTMAGGRLSSLHGVTLGNDFSGYGTVDTGFTNNGSVTGGSGYNTLRFNERVDGTGSFAGNVEFGNIYSPGNSPAAVDFGSVTFGDTSLLQLKVGGPAPGGQHDVLRLSGTAVLEGTLDLDLINGFTPTLGDSFQIMTFGSSIGEFAAVDGWQVNANLCLVPFYHATDVTMVACLTADANGDGRVSFEDFAILQNNYGQSGDWRTGDFNFDHRVDFADFAILQNHYGITGTGGAVAAPEPMSLGLMVLGAGLLLHRRDRRRTCAAGVLFA